MEMKSNVWPNGCDHTAPAALRYLAENRRPIGGEDMFNAARLLQIADELELAVAESQKPRERSRSSSSTTELVEALEVVSYYLSRQTTGQGIKRLVDDALSAYRASKEPAHD
jgi:hypothetical protein